MNIIKNGKTLADLGLNWKVALETLWLTGVHGQRKSASFAVVRQDNGAELGVVGKRYTPLQNDQLEAVANRIINTTDAKWDTGGQFNGGKQVFLGLKLPYIIRTSGSDITESWLTLFNPHFGGSARVSVSTTRPVCRNTIPLAWSTSLESFFKRVSLRHTKSLTERLNEVEANLGEAMQACKDYETQSKLMLKYKYSPADLERFLKEMGFSTESASPNPDKFDRQRDEFLASIKRGVGQDGISNTAWGLLQGSTFYADHVKEYKGDKAFSLAFGAGAEWKQKALTTALEMSK